MAFFKRAFLAYDRALQSSPVITKTLTSVVLFAAGDVMAQKLEGRMELDTSRLLRQAGWAVIFSPLAHGWYIVLDRMVPGAASVGVVLKKTLLDQTTWTPVINSVFLFSVTAMMTGSAAKSAEAVRERLWPTLLTNWVVWPPISGESVAVRALRF